MDAMEVTTAENVPQNAVQFETKM